MSLCECGCGRTTNVAKKSNKTYGHVEGQHVRFCLGHNVAGVRGSASPNYKTGRTLMVDGYYVINIPPDDPYFEMAYVENGRQTGRVKEHRYIMAVHIGRPLLKSEQVHHIDGNKQNNIIDNLVLFPNAAAHSAYHAKLRRENV